MFAMQAGQRRAESNSIYVVKAVRRFQCSAGVSVVGSAVSLEARRDNRVSRQASLNPAPGPGRRDSTPLKETVRVEQLRREPNDMLLECVAVHSCQSSGTVKMHLLCLIRKFRSIHLFGRIGITVTRLRKDRLFNELRNARDEEVLPENSVLPIALIQRVMTVITFFYTLSKRNAQIAGQHMRAVSDLGVGCSLTCCCFVVLSTFASNFRVASPRL